MRIQMYIQNGVCNVTVQSNKSLLDGATNMVSTELSARLQ